MPSELRSALRVHLSKPAFTIAAVLILATGIGANTTVFSVANIVLLKSLPYPDADKLVALYEARPRERVEDNVVSIPDFLDWRSQSTTCSKLAAYEGSTYTLSGRGDPEQVPGAVVTSDFFDVLGVRPMLGHGFDQNDERPEGSRAVVLTHRLWTRRFGSDPLVVGRSITLNGWPHLIAGVMPPEFIPPSSDWEVFSSMKFDASSHSARGNHNLSVIGRLKDGSSIGQARQEMEVISKRLESSFPVNRGHYANVVPFDQAQFGKLRPAMRVLMAAVGLVLLIACFNVANLLLARSVTRAREVSIRMAIGASRGRIVRQLLTESVTLSLAAAAIGLAIAVWTLDYLKAVLPQQLGLTVGNVQLDIAAVAFAIVIAVLSGIGFGLAPALTAVRSSVGDVLRSGTWNQTFSISRQRQRSAIVAAEMAISVMLLVCSGLLVRSFRNLLDVDPGLRPEKVLTMSLSLPAASYGGDAKKIAFQKQLLERVNQIPGVAQTGITSFLPLTGQNSRMGLIVEDIEPDANEPRRANWRLVTPGYIETMQIPLRAGRLFTDADRHDTPVVMLINETAARKYWGGRNPVGTRARLASVKEWGTVIGVVGDVKHWGLDGPSNPEAYLSLWQSPFWLNNLVIRTQGDPLAVAQSVRQALFTIDKDLPPTFIRSMQDVVDTSTSLRRFYMLLMACLAGIALVLAAAGIYAQLAYSVSQRMREIGLRMALGASQSDTVRLIVRQGLSMSLTGASIGTAGAIAVSRLLESLLFGVKPLDPVTLLVAPMLLLTVATLASLLPSWKASQADPAASLRHE